LDLAGLLSVAVDSPWERGGNVAEGGLFLCYLKNHQFLKKRFVQSRFEGNLRFCKYIYGDGQEESELDVTTTVYW